MPLNMRNKQDCRYDAVALGEVMLRLDPGDARIRAARSFTVYEGGGEYNVAQAVSLCFGLHTAALTAFADNEIGHLLERMMRASAVDTAWIRWFPYDGIGKATRNGINFTERGFGVRNAVGISDRANSAASQLRAKDFDWDKLFGTQGVRLLHTGGIFAALSDSALETLLTCLRKAREYGTLISYDLNYRASVWNANGGCERARAVHAEILPLVDILIGNDKEYPLCTDSRLSEKYSLPACEQTLSDICRRYPNLQTACAIFLSPDNSITGVCRCGTEVYRAPVFSQMDILDPVGAGDAFAAGFLYGLLEGCTPARAMALGAAHSALGFTTTGDTSFVTKAEVEALADGTGSFIR